MKWLAVEPFGKPIILPSQNKIVPFKTPRTDLNPKQCITVSQVKNHYKSNENLNLRFIIDLTNTDKYYKFEAEEGLEHFKMKCRGQQIPPASFTEDFERRMVACEA